MRTAIAALLIAIATCTVAHASEFDGWTLAQLKAHPHFVSIENEVLKYNPMAEQREWNSPDAPLTHNWIGYIAGGPEDKWVRVMIDDQGATSTVVFNGEDEVAGWCRDAIDYLWEVGYFEGYPD